MAESGLCSVTPKTAKEPLHGQAKLNKEYISATKESMSAAYNLILNEGDWSGAKPVRDFVNSIKEALEDCHNSFRKREHGGVAESKLRTDLQRILGIYYE